MAALTAISTLDVELADYKGETVVGSLDQVMINKTEVEIDVQSGQFWMFLLSGSTQWLLGGDQAREGHAREADHG